MKKISIIMPAYNEEKRIGKTLENYGKVFSKLKKDKILDFEILVVLNACKDNTLDVVKKYKKKFKEIRFLDFKQGGKGFAVTEGFKDALKRKNDLIGFVDADLATDAVSFYDLVKNIDNYDGIIASRYLRGSKILTKQPLQRIIVSRGGNFIIRTLFLLPYRDTQCGAKIFTKQSIEEKVPKIGNTEWAFDIDMLYLAKKLGYKIKEYPTIWQEPGSSSLNLKKVGPRMLLATINLRLINSPFKRIKKPLRPITKLLYDFFK